MDVRWVGFQPLLFLSKGIVYARTLLQQTNTFWTRLFLFKLYQTAISDYEIRHVNKTL
jgi:hypothetical protein